MSSQKNIDNRSYRLDDDPPISNSAKSTMPIEKKDYKILKNEKCKV